MSLEDHLVEIRRLLGGEATQPEVIDDEQIRCQKPPQDLLGRAIGTRLMQPLEHAVGAEEEHVMTRTARGMAEGAGKERFADTDGPEEDRVLVPVEETEPEQLLHAVAIEGHRRVPVEAFEGRLVLEARALDSRREVLLIAPIDFVLQDEFEEVELRELLLLRVRHPVGQGREQTRELQAFHRDLQ